MKLQLCARHISVEGRKKCAPIHFVRGESPLTASRMSLENTISDLFWHMYRQHWVSTGVVIEKVEHVTGQVVITWSLDGVHNWGPLCTCTTFFRTINNTLFLLCTNPTHTLVVHLLALAKGLCFANFRVQQLPDAKSLTWTPRSLERVQCLSALIRQLACLRSRQSQTPVDPDLCLICGKRRLNRSSGRVKSY